MCSSWYLCIQAKKTFTLLQKASSEVGVCQKQLLQCMFGKQATKQRPLHMCQNPITSSAHNLKEQKRARVKKAHHYHKVSKQRPSSMCQSENQSIRALFLRHHHITSYHLSHVAPISTGQRERKEAYSERERARIIAMPLLPYPFVDRRRAIY